MNNIRKTFILLIISTVIAYSEYAIVAFFQGVVVDYSFTRYSLDISAFGIAFRFIKEILLILLIIQIVYYWYKNRKSIKIKEIKSKWFILAIILLSIEGIISGIFSNNNSIIQYIAGIRGVAYISAAVVVALEFNSRTLFKKYCTILDILFGMEFLIVIAQAIQLVSKFDLNNLVEMRVCGTFGHCVNLATFLLAYALNIFIITYILKIRSEKVGILNNIACSIAVIISGSRTAMILIVLIIIVMIIISITKNFEKYHNKIDVTITVMSIAMFSLLIKGIELIAGRGSIIQNNIEEGRIKILFDYLIHRPLKEVLFGSGLGYGTNTGVLIQNSEKFSVINADIMDGTINTIISQFGIITLIILIITFFIFVKWFIKDNYKFRIIVGILFLAFLGIMMLNGNIFEQYSFIIMISYSILSIKVLYIEEGIKRRD